MIRSMIGSFFGKFLEWSYSPNHRACRLLFIIAIYAIGYGAVVTKLVTISLQDAHETRKYSAKNNRARADVLDRNGHVIATNVPLFSLYANPKKVIDPKYAVKKLKTILTDLNSDKLLEELESDKNFVWIKKDITPNLQEDINGLGLPGIGFESEQKRVYTQGSESSHLLGYVDTDNKGLAGIEKYFNEPLESEHNKGLTLSIDYRIQSIVSDEVDKVISKFSALGGVGIVADPNTGEILAMVSKPDFDPHSPGLASKDQLFNRASLGTYEMGSVLKIPTFAIGLDTNTIDMHDVYNIASYNVGRFRIKDYHNHDGWNTVPQMFMNSSNIGSGMIALDIGKQVYLNYIDKLGMTKKLPIEIQERAYPIFPSTDKITDLSLITMSYGYGFSVSPLHFVQAMIPIVNGGNFYPVTLLKRKDSVVPEKIFSEDTSMNMIKLMRLTVMKGTGKNANVKGYLVAGKTGTTDKLNSKGVYEKNHRFSSFIAVAPSINPRFLVFVFIDDPRGIKETFGFATSGYTAAPTVKNILSRIGSLYGMQPYNEDDKQIKDMFHIDYGLDNET